MTNQHQQPRADRVHDNINKLRHAYQRHVDPEPSDVTDNVSNQCHQHALAANPARQHREHAPVVNSDLANQQHQNEWMPALQRQRSSETIASITTTGSGVVDKFYSVRRGWRTGVFTSRYLKLSASNGF